MKNGRKCLKCREIGHIAKNCSTKNDKDENEDECVDVAIFTVASTALKATENSLKSNK